MARYPTNPKKYPIVMTAKLIAVPGETNRSLWLTDAYALRKRAGLPAAGAALIDAEFLFTHHADKMQLYLWSDDTITLQDVWVGALRLRDGDQMRIRVVKAHADPAGDAFREDLFHEEGASDNPFEMP